MVGLKFCLAPLCLESYNQAKGAGGMEKVYLTMRISVSPEGVTTPLAVENEHGRIYEVQVIKQKKLNYGIGK